MSNELKIESSCSNCGFSTVVKFNIGEDGAYTIPAKFCPDCLTQLKRDILENEPTKNKTRTPDPIPKPTRPVEVSKDRIDSSKKT